jgi:hypothetical protein
VVLREGGSAWSLADLEEFTAATGAPIDGSFSSTVASLTEVEREYPGATSGVQRHPAVIGGGIALVATLAAFALGVVARH